MGFLLFCLLVGAIILYPKLILKGIWAMIVGGAVIFGLIIVLARSLLPNESFGVMSVMTQRKSCWCRYEDLKDWVFLCGKCLTDVKTSRWNWKSKKK